MPSKEGHMGLSILTILSTHLEVHRVSQLISNNLVTGPNYHLRNPSYSGKSQSHTNTFSYKKKVTITASYNWLLNKLINLQITSTIVEFFKDQTLSSDENP